MYGMVNQAIRGMVVENFGVDRWRSICEEAGAPEEFISMDSYDDAITYNLVAAAEGQLETPAAQILRGFGVYWVEKVALVHYADLMNASGVTFLDFVKNLDHMHQRIRVSFPDYNPPSFRVKATGEGRLQVDYYSERPGLLPFVEGLFAGLATHFKVELLIEKVPDDSHPLPCKRMNMSYQEQVQN